MTDTQQHHDVSEHADAADDAAHRAAPGLSRRRMFIAGAGVAGAAALATAGTASAADGENAVIGELNEGEDGATIFENTKPGATPLAGAENALQGTINNVQNGSHAVVGSTLGAGAGIGGTSADGYGGQFVGGKAHVRLIVPAATPAGAPADTAHLIGELYADGAGNLFYNRADGSNFTQLNNQGGIVLLPNSQRAFDSRTGFSPANSNKGRFAAKETRKIDLNEFTDLPDGASGVIANVTAADTGAPGFLTVFRGDLAVTDKPPTATVNWLDSGKNVNNGVTFNVGPDGTVWVFAEGDTEVVIDIIGYIS